MKKLQFTLAITAILLTMSAHAAPVTSLSFNTGLNTGYSVDHIGNIDGNVDWFTFYSNGADMTSFYFDRTVAAPDLVAVLYSGDTNGFDYVAAGAGQQYSYWDADILNMNLTYVDEFDDSHPNIAGGMYGDPDFNMLLAAGIYSLALSSLDQAGTYEFTSSTFDSHNSVPNVPIPAAVWLFGSGFIGLTAIRKKSAKLSTLSA
ncbi:MAG: VPLPA-CTERM sorting domain-containing protein [Methylococcales bacterium]|nr:VPLPA-CTERM sorting domain-containing protein [Methylococcales bacterium]MCK5924666.1 VPLPA-CTERM sorting domain-containing protein [Methylococcales bacterium]